MNKLHDMVRLLLTQPGLSHRDIAASLHLSRRTVDRYRLLIEEGGHTWDSLRELNGPALNAAFNRPCRAAAKVQPDFAAIDRAMRAPGATLLAVWEDYRAEYFGQALAYAQYARLYRAHRKAHNLVMRQTHRPGQHVLTDYSGVRPHYTDRSTGQIIPVELFVGVLGSSHYTFACCTATQTVPDWIDAHTRMLKFFGGAPAAVIPDNLRSGVTKSGAEPTIQRTYLEWARHHSMAVLPARPGHPRDKGAVEGAVLIVQRWMLPKLALHTFFSLEEVDAAVAGLLTSLNARPFQKRAGSRQSEFVGVERPALQPLPSELFVYRQWMAKQTVPRDYHVAVLGHFYSVPHTLVGRRVEACMSATHLEVFCDRDRVARHLRATKKGGHTTVAKHQPPEHRAQAERTPEGLLAWAQTVGPSMHAIAQKQFQQKVPLQGLPACAALRNLARGRTPEELEAAARRALELDVPNPTGVRRMLDSRALQVPALAATPAPDGGSHRVIPLAAGRRRPRPELIRV